MRGQGITIDAIKYDWVKQPNGRYTILNVPIFATYDDKERGKATVADLKRAVETFQRDKERYHYPRLIVGHHTGMQNQPGAGYYDNLYVDPKKEIVYADLVEIYPEVFQQIKNLQYPYVSSEYLPDKDKIKNVALLESQSPYFSFPMIVLKDQPINLSFQQISYANIRDKVIIFQESEEECDKICGKCSKFCDCTKEYKMEEKEKKPMIEGESPEESMEKKDGAKDEEQEEELDLNELEAQYQQLMDAAAKLRKFLDTRKKHESEEEYHWMGMDGAKKGSVSSVAYQEISTAIRMFQSRIDKQDQMIGQLCDVILDMQKKEQRTKRLGELRKVCDAHHLDYAANKKKLLRFQDDDQQKAFVEGLKETANFSNATERGRNHPMINILGDIPSQTTAKKMMGEARKSKHETRAKEIWMVETTQPNQARAKAFQKNFGKAQDFVDFIMAQENPDDYMDAWTKK